MVTGKQEHVNKTIKKIKEILKDQPSYVSGYYYYMQNSSKTASCQTHLTYIRAVVRFLNKTNKNMEDITMDDITCYLSELAYKEDGSPTSGSYLVAVYSGLKKFFKYLVVSERIEKDPMQYIDRPAPKKAEMVERTYLTKREIKACFKYIDDNNDGIWSKRDKAILVVFFFTGIRNTCLTEINVENVDFDNDCIYVLDKGTKPKTCYLSKDKMDVLREWVTIRNNLVKDTQALFINTKGNRLEPVGTTYIIKKITSQIGHEISPHKARASFATNALDSGLNLYEVSKLMNHASTQVTAACYIQGQDKKIKEAGLKATNFMTF